MKPPIRLVPDQIPHETISALEALLVDAKRQNLIGIAYVGLYKKSRAVIANAAGELYRSPDVTRGYLAQLHDALGRLARGEPMPPGW